MHLILIKIQNMMDINVDLLQWFIIFFEIISYKKLAEELHKPIIRKFNRRKVISLFIDNVWIADLADMELFGNKFNKGFRFLLCVIDIYSKDAWVIPLKDKKVITITNAFQEILDESNRKPNKIWADKGSEFYNRSMKSFLQDNDVETYSTHNEGKSVLAERFIRTLKNKNCEYMTSISRNVYIDKLDDIFNKYKNTYLSTIKMKPVDVKLNIYINSSKEINDKILNLKLLIFCRISKYKKNFAKGYSTNWSEEDFAIQKK